jgi:hypothetical protein
MVYRTCGGSAGPTAVSGAPAPIGAVRTGAALLRMGLASPLVPPRSLLGRVRTGGLASPLVVIAVQVVTTITKGFSYERTAPTLHFANDPARVVG